MPNAETVEPTTRFDEAQRAVAPDAHPPTDLGALHERLRRRADVFTTVLEFLRALKAREKAP